MVWTAHADHEPFRKLIALLTVGIPKEIKTLERRVGLTPSGVRVLCEKGIAVFVEKGAGLGSGFSDGAYLEQGAKIAASAKALYGSVNLIQKVKEPLALEFPLFRENQIFFCFLHLASPENCDLVKALIKAKVTAIGYETVQVGGRTPILKPMSEIAGALSASYAAYFLNQNLLEQSRENALPEMAVELAKIADAYPSVISGLRSGNVVVFDGGVAGTKAAEYALATGGCVCIVENNAARRHALGESFLKKDSPRVKISSAEDALEDILAAADTLIGSVHAPGKRAQRVITPAFLEAVSKSKKKVIMDIAVDQGGNFPETRPTTYEKPVYYDSYGNLRFAVANIPSLCGRGASEALTEVTLKYVLAMAENFSSALKRFPELFGAINLEAGSVKIPVIKEAHQI